MVTSSSCADAGRYTLQSDDWMVVKSAPILLENASMSSLSLAASSGLCRMRYSQISSIIPVAIGTDSRPTGSWLSGGGVAWLAAGPSSRGVICSLGELIRVDSIWMLLWVSGVGLSLGIESRSLSPSLPESDLWEDRAVLARGMGGAYRRRTAVVLDLPEALELGRSE